MKRQLTSILILPFNVALIIPFVLYFLCGGKQRYRLLAPSVQMPGRVVGSLLVVGGLPLLVLPIRDFVRIGMGTLAPWDPTQRLVVSGIYRYVRNPMITGVITILFGVAFLYNTVCHLIWAVLFTVVNMIYMPLAEEPGLERRFGDDYRRYKQNVPRWLPRPDPWDLSQDLS